MQLQCGKNDAFWGRLRKRQTPPLLFLFAPDVTWVPTSRFVRSVHAVSVSESDHHENVLSRSSSEQPPLDSFYSPSSVGKKDKKRGKLTTQTVGGPTRAEADEEGEQDKECLKVSCRGDGEEVLVEIPVIEGLPVGGEGDGKMETAKLWKCNECGGLFKTERGLHVHAALKHRRDGQKGSESSRQTALERAVGLCIHKRSSSHCPLCRPWIRTRYKCEHGRVRSTCKECGGGSLCEHGRQRSQCKKCGGGSICEHGRVRSRCKECRLRKVSTASGVSMQRRAL